MKICPNCQLVYEDEITFCGKCGMALVEQGIEESVAVEAEGASTTEETQPVMVSTETGMIVTQTKSKKKTWIILGIFAAIVLALILFLTKDPVVGKYRGTAAHMSGTSSVLPASYNITLETKRDKTFQMNIDSLHYSGKWERNDSKSYTFVFDTGYRAASLYTNDGNGESVLICIDNIYVLFKKE